MKKIKLLLLPLFMFGVTSQANAALYPVEMVKKTCGNDEKCKNDILKKTYNILKFESRIVPLTSFGASGLILYSSYIMPDLVSSYFIDDNINIDKTIAQNSLSPQTTKELLDKIELILDKQMKVLDIPNDTNFSEEITNRNGKEIKEKFNTVKKQMLNNHKMEHLKNFNQLSINAVGKKEVTENYLTVELSTKQQNDDPKILEQNIITSVNNSIEKLKQLIASKDNDVKITTGNFYIVPKYEKNSSKISTWEGKGSIIIEGRDLNTIRNSISKLNTDMVVSGVRMSLAKEDFAKYKNEVMNSAIENFKKEASEYAKSFGFGDYTIRNVNLNYNDYATSYMNNPPLMSARAMSSDYSEDNYSKTLEILPNKVELMATINGTIVMHHSNGNKMSKNKQDDLLPKQKISKKDCGDDEKCRMETKKRVEEKFKEISRKRISTE